MGTPKQDILRFTSDLGLPKGGCQIIVGCWGAPRQSAYKQEALSTVRMFIGWRFSTQFSAVGGSNMWIVKTGEFQGTIGIDINKNLS